MRVVGARAACVVRALAEAQGLAVAGGDSDHADLAVVEVSKTEDVKAGLNGAPLVAVADRRLREAERRALLDAGARAVIDAESSVLDVALAFSDLLFGSRAKQRRYDRVHGGIPVKVRAKGEAAGLRHGFAIGARSEAEASGDGRPGSFRAVPGEAGRTTEVIAWGKLVDLHRAGAFVATESRLPEGSAIELELEILGDVVPVQGRVAFVNAPAGPSEDRPGFGVEFAHGAHDVAPTLFAVCDRSVRRAG